MRKTHLRTYRLTADGEIQVTKWADEGGVDMTGAYRDVVPDEGRPQAMAIDVYRLADDRIVWAPSGDGNTLDVDAALAIELLLGIFLDDLQRSGVDERAF